MKNHSKFHTTKTYTDSKRIDTLNKLSMVGCNVVSIQQTLDSLADNYYLSLKYAGLIQSIGQEITCHFSKDHTMACESRMDISLSQFLGGNMDL